MTVLQATPRWGELGGSLDYLRSSYSAPRPGIDSNCYIDMLDGSFRRFAVAHGLTNIHALFVVSHGKAMETEFGMRYAFYPEKSEMNVPCYSAGDLARLIGQEQAREIRILVLAGCNQGNFLSTKELRHYFPNATTIIHATSETDANLASFWEMLTYPSQELSGIHRPEDLASRHFGASASKGGGYIAELFRPGERKPYRKQRAGSELLQRPGSAPALANR